MQSDNFAKGMEIVANRHGVDYLPTSFTDPVRFRNTLLYISMDSMKPDYEPFDSLKRAALKDYADGICEFVCHPGYIDSYLLRHSSLLEPRVFEVEMACSEEVKQWLKDNKIEVVSYDDLV